MKKILPVIIIIVLAVGAGAFYRGIKYAESKSPQAKFTGADFQKFGGATALGERENRGQFGAGASPGSLSGEIISQSQDSLTIKLANGSTKIVFVSESTQITKSIEGNLTDLSEGEQIFVGGTENSDGSYTAKTIRLGTMNGF